MDKLREEEVCLRTKSGRFHNLSGEQVAERLEQIKEQKIQSVAEYTLHIKHVEKERQASAKARDESRHDCDKLYIQVWPFVFTFRLI